MAEPRPMRRDDDGLGPDPTPVRPEQDLVPYLTEDELLDRVEEPAPWGNVGLSLRAGADLQRNHRERRSEG